MEFLLLLLIGLSFPFKERLLFKFNSYLFIDLFIGRKNFKNFLLNEKDYIEKL